MERPTPEAARRLPLRTLWDRNVEFTLRKSTLSIFFRSYSGALDIRIPRLGGLEVMAELETRGFSLRAMKPYRLMVGPKKSGCGIQSPHGPISMFGSGCHRPAFRLRD